MANPQPDSEFQRDKQRATGFRGECKTCRADAAKLKYNKNPDIYRVRSIKRLYNITLSTYNDLLKSQNDRCAICARTKEENNRYLCVDHCHKTGKIRGLLCSRCNRALGLLKDSKDILNNAIDYITRYST